MTQTHRALALFSGGLDSILSVLWVQKLGIDVIPIFFRTPFFTEERALHSAQVNNLNLIVIDISEQHLAMLKNPRYGFGKNFNPCIDCHGLMFRMAGTLMDKYQADFLISGEVLSQRPMSQRRDSLNAVSNLSEYKDFLLVRPLSQQLLPDTLPVREGWLNKADLLAFSGRSRKPQIALARNLGVVDYPGPAGGCRLTDRNYTARLNDLVNHNQLELQHIRTLSYGRHFRLDDQTKLIIGRDETDNQNLLDLQSGYLYLENETDPGPLGLLSLNHDDSALLQLSVDLLAYYYKKSPDNLPISYGYTFPLDKSIISQKAREDLIQAMMIKVQ